MSSLGYRQDPEFEDRLRTMLQRRAKDVRPNPRPFKELMADADGVVVSLHTGRPMAEAPPPRRFQRPWVRPVAAAAACLAVAMGAGIAIGRSSNDSGEAGEQADSADVPTEQADLYAAPGDAHFAPGTAEILYPSGTEAEVRAMAAGIAWAGDPVSATTQYLADRGVTLSDDGDYEVWADLTEQTVVTAGDGKAIEIASVWWSQRLREVPVGDEEAPIVANGPAYLRNLADEDEPDAWVVVGAKAFGLLVSDIRREGDAVTFNVTVSNAAGAEPETSQQQVQVRVNGELISQSQLALDQQHSFRWDVAPDEPVVIRVQQIGRVQETDEVDRPLSVTEVAFRPLATAPPPTISATTAPPDATSPTR